MVKLCRLSLRGSFLCWSLKINNLQCLFLPTREDSILWEASVRDWLVACSALDRLACLRGKCHLICVSSKTNSAIHSPYIYCVGKSTAISGKLGRWRNHLESYRDFNRTWNLNSDLLEVVSLHRDPQLQVGENNSICLIRDKTFANLNV